MRVVDTMLLSPNRSPLGALGEALGLPKVELPEGYSKERMDLFLGPIEEFIAYAMTDAEIAARWTARFSGSYGKKWAFAAMSNARRRRRPDAPPRDRSGGPRCQRVCRAQRGRKGGKAQPLPISSASGISRRNAITVAATRR